MNETKSLHTITKTNQSKSHYSPSIINQRNTAVLLVERKAIGHTNAVSPIRLGQLSFDRVLSTVNCFAYAFVVVLEELEHHMGILITSLTGFAARDDVEFVVGQFEGFVDANSHLDRSLFAPLKKQILRGNSL